MDYAKKLNELKIMLQKNVSQFYNNEMPLLIELLQIKDGSSTNIFNKNDTISLYEFKNEVLYMVVKMIDDGFIIQDELFINTIANLLIINKPNLNLDFSFQLEEILKKIWKKCLKILFYSGKIEKLQQIENFLYEQEIPDFRNVCLSLIFKCSKFKSYDLENLSKFISLSVLYDVVKIFKNDLILEIQGKILYNLYIKLEGHEETLENNEFFKKIQKSSNLLFKDKSKYFDQQDVNYCYLIFYEINFMKFNELIRSPKNEIFTNEYLLFIYSLIVDEESAILAFQIFQSNEVYSDLFNGINYLLVNQITNKQKIDPLDEKYLFILLEVVTKILKFAWNVHTIKINFLLFIEPIMKYIEEDVNEDAKSACFDFLTIYLQDSESFLTITEYFQSSSQFSKTKLIQEFDKNFNKKYFLIVGRLLKFLFYINMNLSIEMALYALRSEDPSIIESCFELFSKSNLNLYNDIFLNIKYIRRAMLKSENLKNILINYQIENKIVFEDVLFINTIMSSSNLNFFKFAKLFVDFGKFMNEKFLERLVENVEEGLDFLEKKMSSNIVKFIKNNEKWFNFFTKNNMNYYFKITNIYEKMLEIDKNLEISFKDGLLLFEISTPSMFKILAQKLLFSKYKNKYITNKYYELTEESLKEYCLYLKIRIFVNNCSEHNLKDNFLDNVEPLIENLISVNKNIDDLLSFYKIVTNKNIDVKNKSMICMLNEISAEKFISNFNYSSYFERFLLFLKLQDKLSYEEKNEILKIVKNEIIRINLSLCNSTEDKLIYKQCLLLLLKLDNIDSVIRLINDYEDKNLLLKINIKNIMTGGTFFNNNCIMQGSFKLQVNAVTILYFNNLLSVSVLRDWISTLYKDGHDNEDLRYLVSDLQKKHDIEIY